MELNEKEVWTVSTLFVLDCFVEPSNFPGFRVFSGAPSVCKAENIV